MKTLLEQGTGLDPFGYGLTGLRRGAYYITLANFANATPFAGFILFRMLATDATKTRELVANYKTGAPVAGFRVEINTSAQMRFFIAGTGNIQRGSSTAVVVGAGTAIQGFYYDYDGTDLRVSLNRATLVVSTPAIGGYVAAPAQNLTFGVNVAGASTSQCDAIDWLGWATGTATNTQVQVNATFDAVKLAIDVVNLPSSPGMLFSVKQKMSDGVGKPVFSDAAAALDLVIGGGTNNNLPSARPEVTLIDTPTWGW